VGGLVCFFGGGGGVGFFWLGLVFLGCLFWVGFGGGCCWVCFLGGVGFLDGWGVDAGGGGVRGGGGAPLHQQNVEEQPRKPSHTPAG